MHNQAHDADDRDSYKRPQQQTHDADRPKAYAAYCHDTDVPRAHAVAPHKVGQPHQHQPAQAARRSVQQIVEIHRQQLPHRKHNGKQRCYTV